MPAKPLTQEQKADAERLLEIFKARKEHLEPGLTQSILADDLGFSTQSAVSQYFQGKVPLNVEAAVKFAARLECAVADFSPAMQESIDRIAAFSSMSRHGDKQKSASTQDKQGAATGVATKYAAASHATQAAVDVLLLPKGERAALDNSDLRITIIALEGLATEVMQERKVGKKTSRAA